MYFAKIETAKVELEKRAKQFKALPELTETIVQSAIMAIQEKVEKAKAKKTKSKTDK